MAKHKKQPKFRYTLIDEMCASPTEPLPEAWQRTELTAMWDGLAQIECGQHPDKFDWGIVTDCINFSIQLTRMGETQDLDGLLDDAMQVVGQAGHRYKAGQPMRLSGPGMQTVRAVLEDYAQVIAVLPARTMIRCHRLTERRVIEILKGMKLSKYEPVESV